MSQLQPNQILDPCQSIKKFKFKLMQILSRWNCHQVNLQFIILLTAAGILESWREFAAQCPRNGRVQWFLQFTRSRCDGQIILQHARIHFQFHFEIRLGRCEDQIIREGDVGCRTIDRCNETCVENFGANFGQKEDCKTPIIPAVLKVVRILPH